MEPRPVNTPKRDAQGRFRVVRSRQGQRTLGLSPKLPWGTIAAVLAAIGSYLLTQTVLDLPKGIELAINGLLVGLAAATAIYQAPPGVVRSVAPFLLVLPLAAANDVNGRDLLWWLGIVIVVGCFIGAIVLVVRYSRWVEALVLVLIAVVAAVLLL